MRVFYWVLLSLTVAAVVGLATSGYAALPAGPGLLAAVVLIVDASIRRSVHAATAVTALITGAVVVGVIATVLSLGLGNAYATTIVDRPASTITEFRGMDFVEEGRICRGGEDYLTCVDMHLAMYNSLCVTPRKSLLAAPSWVRLSLSAQAQCDDLSTFVDDVKARSKTCGDGCTTVADKNGRWGWPYLTPVALTEDVKRDEISHVEHCWFKLGPVALGQCSIRSAKR